MRHYRWDVINHLIESRNYQSYLEIGVLGGDCFRRVKAPKKVGVDPNSGDATYRLTSDAFFESIASAMSITYDIVFVDGLHLEAQTLKDIQNSLNHLSLGGSIVVHDCLPEAEYQQLEKPTPCMPWNGTVWKTWAKLRCLAPALRMSVVNCDWGCGVIQSGMQKVWECPPMEFTWDYYQRNRDELMNVISWEEFKCEY